MRRVPRVAPDVDLHYKEWVIPKGVSLFHFMHSIFPNSCRENNRPPTPALIPGSTNPNPHRPDPSRHVGIHDAHRRRGLPRAVQVPP